MFVGALCSVGLTGAALPGPTLVPFPANLSGTVVFVVALVLAGAERTAMNANGQSGLYTDRPTVLITTGVFRRSRNPLYLAMMLVVLAAALLFGTLVPLLVVVGAGMVMTRWVIMPEERVLDVAFGDEYRSYRASVSRWFRVRWF